VSQSQLDCVFLGLSITSTWGNGHATTYRGLLKELARRGHRITFLERDVPWYGSNREFNELPYCAVELYSSVDELKDRFSRLIQQADVVVVGSYVPEGIGIGRWVTATAHNIAAFYDIDTPITLANLRAGCCEYISKDLYPAYHIYFSFTGGPTLKYVEKKLGSRCARALYCSVDPALYYPERREAKWDLAYLGTYAADRQQALEKLLVDVARNRPERRFAVAGPQYPETVRWPPNVDRIEHLPANEHRAFYNSQNFTLNVTRQDMLRAGYSPSVRLFEAAACGVPILTDVWPGLESFFKPRLEILPVLTGDDVTSYMQIPNDQRLEIAERARNSILCFHTAAVRAVEFEKDVRAALDRHACAARKSRSALKESPTAALI
jgi:spore maturation protein CgeB